MGQGVGSGKRSLCRGVSAACIPCVSKERVEPALEGVGEDAGLIVKFIGKALTPEADIGGEAPTETLGSA